MRRHARRIRKSVITKEELIADAIFLFTSALTTLLVVFLFDIHRSFYSWPFTPKTIFNTPYPYMVFVPAGAIIGFLLIKLLLLGIKEEEAGK